MLIIMFLQQPSVRVAQSLRIALQGAAVPHR